MNRQPHKESPVKSHQETDTEDTFRITVLCLISFVVPGLGHAFLRKWDRAAVFFGSITFMFVIGLYLQGELFGPDFQNIFSILKFIADAGIGLFYWIAWVARLGHADPNAYTYDYANKFLYVAGLLNMLVAVDVFDIAMGRKR
jgi:hypothetical protein